MAEGKARGEPTAPWKVGFSAGGVLTASLSPEQQNPQAAPVHRSRGATVWISGPRPVQSGGPGAQRARPQDCRGEALPPRVCSQSPILHACLEPLNSTARGKNAHALKLAAGTRLHPGRAAHRSCHPRSRRRRTALHASAQGQSLALQATGPASSTVRHRWGLPTTSRPCTARASWVGV